jgi:hypothetical protein
MPTPLVLTAGLAIIKCQGVPIGKMKGITINETLRRGKVVGLGKLAADEVPVLDWDGSLSCEFFTVSFKTSPLPGAMTRSAASIEDWTNSVLLQEDGLSISILRRKKTGQHNDPGYPNAKVNVIEGDLSDLEEFATIKGCFLNREGFNINESSISGYNAEFTYTTPILYSI